MQREFHIVARGNIVYSNQIYMTYKTVMWFPAIASHIVRFEKNLTLNHNHLNDPKKAIELELYKTGFKEIDYTIFGVNGVPVISTSYFSRRNVWHMYQDLYVKLRKAPSVEVDKFELFNEERLSIEAGNQRIENLVLENSLRALEFFW